MLIAPKLLHQLALVSFIDILIKDNQQRHQYHYKSVLLHIESSSPVVCDISDQIVQTISDVPVILCDYDQPYQTRTPSYGEPNLNIILLNNRSSITIIKKVCNTMFSSDENIIALVNESDASLPYSPGFLKIANCLHRFVLIRPDSVMVAFRLYRTPLDIQTYTVDMYNRDSVISHFQKVYDHGLVSLNGRPIRVFIHYIPPWSMLSPTDSTQRFYKAIGRDALVTEAILFSLNGTIVLTSDVAIKEPDFGDWFKIKEVNNLEALLLYSDVFSDTHITDFYARYV